LITGDSKDVQALHCKAVSKTKRFDFAPPKNKCNISPNSRNHPKS